MAMTRIIARIFLTALLPLLSASVCASSFAEITRPVPITSQTTEFDESCSKDAQCLRKVAAVRPLLIQIYHSFNAMLYRDEATSLRFTSTEFRASVGQDARVFRKQAIKDAEQVVSFAIQNFESSSSGRKLRLKIYTVLFTEGSLFIVEAYVTFLLSTGNDKWQMDSYELIGK